MQIRGTCLWSLQLETMFQRISPTKGVGRAIKKKLFLKFVGPYQIINLHNVFHVSQLRKYIQEPSHALKIDNVQIKDNMSFKVNQLRFVSHNVECSTHLPSIKVGHAKSHLGLNKGHFKHVDGGV